MSDAVNFGKWLHFNCQPYIRSFIWSHNHMAYESGFNPQTDSDYLTTEEAYEMYQKDVKSGKFKPEQFEEL